MVSPRFKFIAITIDEIVAVIVIVLIVGHFFPDLLMWAVLIATIGTTLFVVAKYYIVYPSLQEGGTVDYDVVGLVGQVVETVTPRGGKIRIGGERWAARCEESEIPAKTRVIVVSREGMQLVVRPVTDVESNMP